ATARDHFSRAVKAHPANDAEGRRYQTALKRVQLDLRLRGTQGRRPGARETSDARDVREELKAGALLALVALQSPGADCPCTEGDGAPLPWFPFAFDCGPCGPAAPGRLRPRPDGGAPR